MTTYPPWASPPLVLTPSDDEVHVWRASLDQPAGYRQWLLPTLSHEERTRAEDFYFVRDRERFIVGRGVLRSILGAYLGIPPRQLLFQYGYYGKPALHSQHNPTPLQFNVSHTEGLGMYAVTRRRAVGIDLERIRPIANLEQLTARRFTRQEHAQLCALPSEQRHQGFFRCWTSKEAYVKARGEGLSLPLDQFVVSVRPDEPLALLASSEGAHETARWTLHEVVVAPDYVATVAVEGDGWRLACWQWTGGGEFQGAKDV
jgi:4'-phosphopantetheinyl transferase